MSRLIEGGGEWRGAEGRKREKAESEGDRNRRRANLNPNDSRFVPTAGADNLRRSRAQRHRTILPRTSECRHRRESGRRRRLLLREMPTPVVDPDHDLIR